MPIKVLSTGYFHGERSSDAILCTCYVCFDVAPDAELYAQTFKFALQASQNRLKPVSISCDFEEGLVAELEELFPPPKTILDENNMPKQIEGCNIFACVFHWKKALKSNMIKAHIPENQQYIAIKRGVLDVLCILPPEELELKGLPFVQGRLFRLIEEKMRENDESWTMPQHNKKQWEAFFRYVKRYWLKKSRISRWNLHNSDGAVRAVQDRSNNALESYNGKILRVTA